MELLLNLFWLLLTIPAFWLWREGRRAKNNRGQSCRFLMILGCLLILLFPVISASDDLRTTRLEAEEPASQDAFRDSLAGRSGQPAQDWAHAFTLPETQIIASVGRPAWRARVIVPTQKAGADVVLSDVGRAPPVPSRG
jgi:hypothetical protein